MVKKKSGRRGREKKGRGKTGEDRAEEGERKRVGKRRDRARTPG
jgi:hypothetical protein